MSDLDDKLKEILVGGTKYEKSRYSHVLDKSITKIRQAFTESGYVYVPQITTCESYNAGNPKPTAFRVNDMIVMTGQEWFNRFEQELKDSGYTGGYVDTTPSSILDNARRASGIQEHNT